eukprot:3096049-Rhodomonas_salina.2
MLVTEDVFHPPIFALKASARINMDAMSVTKCVFHPEMFGLMADMEANSPLISVIVLTSAASRAAQSLLFALHRFTRASSVARVSAALAMCEPPIRRSTAKAVTLRRRCAHRFAGRGRYTAEKRAASTENSVVNARRQRERRTTSSSL